MAAVKTIFLNRVDDELLQQLRLEIQFLSKLDHPNICKLHEVFETSLCVYLVMELLEGGELFDRLKRVKRFPEDVARRLARDMFTAVRYMHSKGICHRDLKCARGWAGARGAGGEGARGGRADLAAPRCRLENFVFVDEREDAPLKLIDFGLSKLFVDASAGGDDGDLQRMHSQVGTSYYMAPEVLRGDYTQKCDAWSLGILLYMLLTGKAPYSGSDPVIERRILSHNVPFRTEHWAHLSEEVQDLVRRLLNKSPSARLSVAEALEHPWLRMAPAGSTALPQSPPAAADGDPAPLFQGDMVAGMTSFGKVSRLKRAALLLMARELPHAEIEDLQRLFAQVDVHSTGRITVDELTEALSRSGVAPETARELFTGLDQDATERIQYSEFIAALAASRVHLDKQHLADTFARMDVSQSGWLDASDLRTVLGSRFSEEDIQAVIREVDTAGDGRVSLPEFFRVMTGRTDQRALTLTQEELGLSAEAGSGAEGSGEGPAGGAAEGDATASEGASSNPRGGDEESAELEADAAISQKGVSVPEVNRNSTQ